MTTGQIFEITHHALNMCEMMGFELVTLCIHPAYGNFAVFLNGCTPEQGKRLKEFGAVQKDERTFEVKHDGISGLIYTK